MRGARTPYAIAAVSLVLLSGAVMVLAGILVHAESWAVGGPVTIIGGVLILAAFAAGRRAFPVASDGVAVRSGAFAATLLSGAVMVLAGYGASAWAWWVAPLLVPIGGLVIMAAFVIELGTANDRT